MKRFYLSLSILALALIGIAAVNEAHAGSLQATWTAPTSNTDGTAIPATGAGSITKYTLYYGLCVGSALPATPTKLDVTALTVTVSGLAPGTWCTAVTATNTFGQESAQTNVATKVILAPTPNPPGNLTLASSTVFQAIGTLAGLQMLPVGTVGADAACDGGNYVVSQGTIFYKIQRTDTTHPAVSWFGSVKPQAIYAACS